MPTSFPELSQIPKEEIEKKPKGVIDEIEKDLCRMAKYKCRFCQNSR